MVERYKPPGKGGKNVIKFPGPNGKRPSRFEKGHVKVGGRKKGSPNKVPALIKNAAMIAMENVGAPVFIKEKGKPLRIENGEGGVVAYLEYAAKHHTAPFLGLVGKILPMQLTGEGGGPIKAITASMTLQEMAQVYQDSLKAEYE